ncbi:MAG: MFS transporter [Gemmataceae bacterium]|nr:MFS transporter [Gemmataceae bacterium]
MNTSPTPRHAPDSPWRWWVCGVLLLATLLNYMDRQALPQTATELKARYDLGDARYGWVEGAFSWAFAGGSVLFGLLADRVGPRRLYPVVLIGWSAAGLATPLLADPAVTAWLEGPDDAPGAGPFRWLVLCRLLLGLFEAGHWPCALLTARHVLSPKDRPLGNGLLQSGATAGAVLIPVYVLVLGRLGGGWEVVFWTVGAVGLLWVPLWLAVVRPGDLPAGRSAAGADPGSAGPGGRDLARMLVALAVVVTGLNVSWQFLRAWLPKYLEESRGFTREAAAGIMIGYYLAADVGCLLSGALVRWGVGRGAGVHAARVGGFALFAAVVTTAAVVPLVGGGWAAAGLLVLAGAGILGLHPYYYALVQELPGRSVGTFGGILAAVGWVVLAGFQVAIGAHIEATRSYAAGLVIVGLAPLLGLAALVILWPRPAATTG